MVAKTSVRDSGDVTTSRSSEHAQDDPKANRQPLTKIISNLLELRKVREEEQNELKIRIEEVEVQSARQPRSSQRTNPR